MKVTQNAHNRIFSGWLLTLVMVVMATATGASWQCLDGRTCPPGCLMTHGVIPNGKRACCAKPAVHCPLCPSGTQMAQAGTGVHCSSSVCVLRMRARPDVTHHSVAFVFAYVWAVLPTAVFMPRSVVLNPTPFPEPVYPPRGGGTRSSSPRAPPALLG